MKKYAVLFLTFASSQAFAWGDLGHRVVGEIAQSRLTPAAQRAVMEISGGLSLAQQATWADEIKSDSSFKWASPFHYISVDTAEFDHAHHDHSKADVYMGIKNNIAVLKAADKSRAEKRQALAFLAHFVGDVHQPLHAGYTDDQGGNLCKVTYFGEVQNLHSVLDSSVLEFKGLSFTELARFIRESKTQLLAGDDLQALSKSDINVWIQESMNARNLVYPNKTNSKISSKVGDVDAYLKSREYCKLPRDTKDTELMPSLDYLYNFKTFDLLKRRMLLAGYRLANVLNETFDSKQNTQAK